MAVGDRIRGLEKRIENYVISKMQKFSYPPFGTDTYRAGAIENTVPAYQREYSPFRLKNLAERQSLVNNSIEEKVNQAFRRGFADWEKRWEAKCPNCFEEFQSLRPFRDQLGDEDADEIDDSDIDFDTKRPCPNCEKVVDFDTPDPMKREIGERYLNRANMRNQATELLPREQSSVSQTFLEVCEEVAFDIQIWDDGWMLFHRVYDVNEEGVVQDWEFEGAYRAPPYLMRYSVSDEQNKIGGEYWVCVKCRQRSPDDYIPQQQPGPCEQCGAENTYECYAYQLDGINGEPVQWFIDGEFSHGSEYRPSRLYGLSPIISLIEESLTLQRMDEWHRTAYAERRAPRGALVISGSNQQSVRAYNREQMEKLNGDPEHIPVFMNDSDDNANPIEFQPLLEEPASMQNMQMREFFKDRISAKFGVTAVFQSGGADNSGMSQSLEIIVANRSAQRLQGVFEDIFIPAFIGQLHITGWDLSLKEPEEEDEQAEAQLIGRELQNARTANELGFEIEWTRNDRVDIKPDKIEPPEEGEGEEGGGLGGLFGSASVREDKSPESGMQETQSQQSQSDFVPEMDDEEEEYSNPSDRPTQDADDVDPAGTTGPDGGRPRDAETVGGKPRDERNPTTDEPYRRADSTVTSQTSGYGNVAYGGKPAEAIDMVEQIEEVSSGDDDDGTADGDNSADGSEKSTAEIDEMVDKLERRYAECVRESGGKLPNFMDIERSCRQRPDAHYRAFKRNHGGEWQRDFFADNFVRQVYKAVETAVEMM